MTKMDEAMARMQVDIYCGEMERLKRGYIIAGMTAEEAEDKAVNEVRREIRNAPTK